MKDIVIRIGLDDYSASTQPAKIVQVSEDTELRKRAEEVLEEIDALYRLNDGFTKPVKPVVLQALRRKLERLLGSPSNTFTTEPDANRGGGSEPTTTAEKPERHDFTPYA